MRTTFGALVLMAVFVLPFGASAQEQDTENERLLTVNGQGIVRGAPDLAIITLGVVSEAKAARDALSANSESMSRIVSALKAEGMEGRDLQTSGFSVAPIYSQPPANQDSPEPFAPEIVGYRAQNNVTLRIRDLTRVGALLDQVVTLGANSISGPSFTVDDPTRLEDEARRAAVADALRKGKLYAEAAGVTLGPIFRVDEGYAQPPRPLVADTMMRMEAAAPASVPIEGGELTFEMQVTILWRLAD